MQGDHGQGGRSSTAMAKLGLQEDRAGSRGCWRRLDWGKPEVVTGQGS